MKEVQFKFLDKDYSVRPDFRRISAIENMTGRGTMEILQDLGDSKFRTTDLIHVIYCMVSDSKISVDKVANEVIGNAVDFVGPVATFLNACNFGSEELVGDDPKTDAPSTEKND